MTELPVNQMKIRALVPWFGAKRNLARRIVKLLGKHSSYFEPFCGSMAVLLAKPESSHENVNDLHGDLINLARVIQDPIHGPWLYRKLRRGWLTETGFLEAREEIITNDCPDQIDPSRAYAFFIISWFGRNGLIGTLSYNFGFCVRWTPKGGHGAKRFASAVDSIPAWRKRMRRVTILRRDGFDFLEKIQDCKGTSIYIDPPYIEKGARYLHDFEPEAHRRLAKLANSFKKARVVISYYDHPLLKDLYRDWYREEISVNKALAHAGQRGDCDRRATEVLLLNPEHQAGQGALF